MEEKKKDNRGGRNCGRKKRNKIGFTVRCKPENKELIKQIINDNDL
jgi:hypothetical protein